MVHTLAAIKEACKGNRWLSEKTLLDLTKTTPNNYNNISIVSSIGILIV